MKQILDEHNTSFQPPYLFVIIFSILLYPDMEIALPQKNNH